MWWFYLYGILFVTENIIIYTNKIHVIFICGYKYYEKRFKEVMKALNLFFWRIYENFKLFCERKNG